MPNAALCSVGVLSVVAFLTPSSTFSRIFSPSFVKKLPSLASKSLISYPV